MNIVIDNMRFPIAKPRLISQSQAVYAAIVVAADRAGIARPKDPLQYPPEQHPHWDFLVRFARRHALCAGSWSLEECIEEATTTARIYMERVLFEGTQ